jgi:PAS domain S-box-containing protein
MLIRWCQLLWALLLWLCLGLVALAETGQPYVLVLASYHPGFAWTDGQIQGVRETLASQYPGVKIRVEYLDTKYVIPTEARTRQLSQLMSSKYGADKPRLLIAQDDDALDFALSERKTGVFANLPILFSGVSGARMRNLVNQPLLTGIFDDADIAANVGLLKKLRPVLKQVFIIHDQSRTGLAQANSVREWQGLFPELQFTFLSDLPVEDIQTQLSKLGPADGVIALAFNRDKNNRVFDHFEAATIWGRYSPVPVLVKDEEMMAPGILGGIMLSGDREGAAVALLAARVLAGESMDALPVAYGVPKPVFSSEALSRFGISELSLPSGSKIVGRKDAVWVTHPVEFWVAVSLLVSSAIVIIILIVAGRREAQARLAIAASERNFREILNAGNEAIVICDLNYQMLEVNERFYGLFGLDGPCDLPAPVNLFGTGVAPYGEKDAVLWLGKVITEGPQLFEWKAVDSKGRLIWVEIALRIAKISGESRILVAIRDISSRKAAEAELKLSEDRYDLLLRYSPAAVMYLSVDWKLTYCNDRFVEIIGAPRSVLIGSDMRQLRDQSILPALAETFLGNEGRYQGEYTATSSGKHLWLDLRAAPVRDESNAVIGCIVIVDEISTRIAAEKTLKAFNETLEQGIAERTSALAQANADLTSAMSQLAQAEKMAALGHLVAGMAHELNTPIGNARMLASTIEDLAQDLSVEVNEGAVRKSSLMHFLKECGNAAKMLDRNLSHSAALIQNFKQVAVDQSSMRRRNFGLKDVVSCSLEMLRPKINQAACLVSIDIPDTLQLDSYPGAIEQIVMNLVTNSIVHGLVGVPNGQISLQAQLDASRGAVTLTYADNGVGMADGHVKKAFDPFFTTTLGQGGSGLGLYIVYNLATAILGGQVVLHSAPGKGVSFVMTFPISSPVKAG